MTHALEVAWGIEDGFLVARSSPLATDLRLTHSAEIDLDQLQSGCNTCIAPHTDFGPVTLLLQDNTSGLEIEDSTDTTGSTPTDTTEMISKVVDTLTRWNNGKTIGCMHQITVPEAMKGERGLILPSPLSAAYLFEVRRDTSVAPLPRFASAEEPAVYPKTTTLEFQRWINSIVYNLDKKEDGVRFNGSPATTPTEGFCPMQTVRVLSFRAYGMGVLLRQTKRRVSELRENDINSFVSSHHVEETPSSFYYSFL